MKLAEDSGATIAIFDVHRVEADDIYGNMINTVSISGESKLERAKAEQRAQFFKEYIGLVVSVHLTWISNNIAYIYSEYAP